jgi:hypothetical protein
MAYRWHRHLSISPSPWATSAVASRQRSRAVLGEEKRTGSIPHEGASPPASCGGPRSRIVGLGPRIAGAGRPAWRYGPFEIVRRYVSYLTSCRICRGSAPTPDGMVAVRSVKARGRLGSARTRPKAAPNARVHDVRARYQCGRARRRHRAGNHLRRGRRQPVRERSGVRPDATAVKVGVVTRSCASLRTRLRDR